MKIIGLAKTVSNTQPEGIVTLWQDFYTKEVSKLIPNKSNEEIISVYTDYEGDYLAPYKTIIGHEVTSLEDIPEGMAGLEIETDHLTKYLVKGELPKVVIEKWQEIWANGKPRHYQADFDRYKSDGSVEIYVGYK